MVAAAFVAAAPFLALQLIQNKGLTGSYSTLPITHYTETEMPGYAAFGRNDPARLAAVKPTSSLPQKQAFFKEFALPLAQEHAGESLGRAIAWRARKTLAYTLPSPARPGYVADLWPASLLLVLAPVGLMVVAGDPRRWVLWAPLPLFVLGYLSYPTMLEHYTVVVAPAVIFAALLGATALIEAVRSPRGRTALSVAAALVPAALAVGALPELNGWQDDPVVWPTMHYNYVELPRQVDAPAVVLFRYSPDALVHEEPVYNVDVAWPDDAPIVRAHDLGPRNRQIIEYFARLQPGRRFYRFDRGDGRLTPLGTAAELAATLEPTTTPATTTQNVK
jgi:hypothetical protein